MRPTKRVLAIGFGLAVALTSGVGMAQRSGDSRGGGARQGAGASHGGGAPRDGSHYSGGGHHDGRSHSGGHSRGSVFLGFGFGDPFWYGPSRYPYAYPYYYPYSYYPPAVIVPEGPRVYVERDDPGVAQEGSSPFWYYCRDSNLYYPYARKCAGQWEQVPAKPQSADR